MSRQRLLDVDRVQAICAGCATTDLVHVPLDACPCCGGALADETVTEMALLRHGGYGASRSSTRRHCPCGWSLTVEVTETRPQTRRSA